MPRPRPGPGAPLPGNRTGATTTATRRAQPHETATYPRPSDHRSFPHGRSRHWLRHCKSVVRGMSKMIEVKTDELIGSSLDWAVAKAEGWPDCSNGVSNRVFRPSSDWGHGGPLIDKYLITIEGPLISARTEDGMVNFWDASISDDRETLGSVCCRADTNQSALVAACRAVVQLKLGDVVSVPAELVGSCV